MREGMSTPPEAMRERGRVPSNVAETLKVLETAQEVSGQPRKEVLQEQIDNLLEAVFDAESGLSPEERQGLQEAAQALKGELDKEDRAWAKLREELVEAGWLQEGEKMTGEQLGKYGPH